MREPHEQRDCHPLIPIFCDRRCGFLLFGVVEREEVGSVGLVDWAEEVDPYGVFAVGRTWNSRRDPLYVPSERHPLARLQDLVVGRLVVAVKLVDPVVPSDRLAFVLVLSQNPMLLPD